MRSQLPKRERAKVMDRFLEMDVGTLMATVKTGNDKHLALTMAIGSLLQDFNMVTLQRSWHCDFGACKSTLANLVALRCVVHVCRYPTYRLIQRTQTPSVCS
eukprot:COSAG05_NODE_162_length_15499_cov_23.006104_10_plen_102_part_00